MDIIAYRQTERIHSLNMENRLRRRVTFRRANDETCYLFLFTIFKHASNRSFESLFQIMYVKNKNRFTRNKINVFYSS